MGHAGITSCVSCWAAFGARRTGRPRITYSARTQMCRPRRASSSSSALPLEELLVCDSLHRVKAFVLTPCSCMFVFCGKEIVPVSRAVLRLCRYYRSVERRERDIAMYPPGRVIFLRPLKVLKKRGPARRMEKRWDAVWVTPEQLMAEGILISKKARPPALLSCARAAACTGTRCEGLA